MAFITNITTTPVTGVYGPDGYPTQIDNDQGNIRFAGNISETGKFSSSSLGEGNPITTIISGVGPVEGAVPGVFNSGLQVIVRAQTKIAGEANTVLEGGSSDTANVAFTPLQLDVLRTYYYKFAVRNNYWNEFNGTWETNVPSNASSGAWNIDNEVDNAGTMRASGVDVAANPSQSQPGRLTFQQGSPNPVNTGYGARYNW
mgnify:FL=1|tara:strand:- start:307 stop:909 length:603 start_codon:yes stop_codon:yes gene_type:complete